MKRFCSSKYPYFIVFFIAIFVACQDSRAAPAAFTVEVTGKGRPMIFIPGLASSAEVWKGTVAHFCGERECHVLNLAGFAGVPAIDAPLLPTAAAQIVEYIDAKHLDHPVIVGHSLGGFLALRIAADHPDKVGKLVIVDSLPALGATQVPDITPEQLKSMAGRMRDSMKQRDAEGFAASQRQSVASMVTAPEDLERILAWGRKSDRTTVIDAMYELMSTDLRGDIARIKTPVLALGAWAAYKAFAPRAAIEATFKAQYQKLPDATIELSENGRHFLMYDDPQWMYERMDKFLK